MYGKTFDEVNQLIMPQNFKKPWGEYISVMDFSRYCLIRRVFDRGGISPLGIFRLSPITYYVEEGSVVFRRRDRVGIASLIDAVNGSCIRIAKGEPHSIYGKDKSTVYGFTDAGAIKEQYFVETAEEAVGAFANIPDNKNRGKCARATNVRSKYWGTIETISSGKVAGKRIFIQSGGQSSLEFHLNKTEAYFVHSGRIKVGFRVGRAENRSLILNCGECLEITPGTMHMRIGIEDSVIIEISTADLDSDSILVEDGQIYRHIEKDMCK